VLLESPTVKRIAAAGGSSKVNGGTNRKGAILKAAARLFRQKGYERTTVRDLAQAVHMQSGSLFFHFKTKEDILHAVAQEGLERAIATLDMTLARARAPREKLAAILRTHLHATLGEERDAFTVVLLDWRSLPPKSRKRLIPLRDDYESHLGRALQDLSKSGVLPKDTKLLRLFLLGALNWTVHWYRPDGSLTIDELADGFLELVLTRS
jgi:TetR/AcrR family transcriptional regulator, cholesterol catabolism regulator